MFQFTKSNQFSVAAKLLGVYGYSQFQITAPPGYQLVSIGWQNSGMMAQLWASQIFIYQGGVTALIQLVNANPFSVDVWIYTVLAVSSDTIAERNPPVVEVKLLSNTESGSLNPEGESHSPSVT